MGVPGRSCLWIQRYWGCVWSVFSCRLQVCVSISEYHTRRGRCKWCALRHRPSRTGKGTLTVREFLPKKRQRMRIHCVRPRLQCYHHGFGGIAS
jgi:hypothetical protein